MTIAKPKIFSSVSSLVAKLKLFILLGILKRYLVPTTFGVIWGRLLKSIVIFLSNFLNQVKLCGKYFVEIFCVEVVMYVGEVGHCVVF
jgi:hypothetical protein